MKCDYVARVESLYHTEYICSRTKEDEENTYKLLAHTYVCSGVWRLNILQSTPGLTRGACQLLSLRGFAPPVFVRNTRTSHTRNNRCSPRVVQTHLSGSIRRGSLLDSARLTPPQVVLGPRVVERQSSHPIRPAALFLPLLRQPADPSASWWLPGCIASSLQGEIREPALSQQNYPPCLSSVVALLRANKDKGLMRRRVLKRVVCVWRCGDRSHRSAISSAI